MSVCKVFPTCRRARRLVVIPAALLVSLALALAGCGGGGQTEFDETEEESVKLALSDVSGAASDPQAFRDLFVEGAAPPDAERSRYRSFMFITSKVTIEGGSATATVQIEDGN